MAASSGSGHCHSATAPVLLTARNRDDNDVAIAAAVPLVTTTFCLTGDCDEICRINGNVS